MCKIRRLHYNWLLGIFTVLSVGIVVGIILIAKYKIGEYICFTIVGSIALVCTTILICFVIKALEKREKHIKDITMNFINENKIDFNSKKVSIEFNGTQIILNDDQFLICEASGNKKNKKQNGEIPIAKNVVLDEVTFNNLTVNQLTVNKENKNK